MGEKSEIVRMRGITKRFPGVVALRGVDFTLRRGTVHALMGENGAGKSTLMKILSGGYASYEGEVLLDGEPVRFASERDALEHGVSIVHQELSPIPELSIAENIFLGREPTRARGVVDIAGRRRMARELIESLGLDFHPDTRMRELNVAKMQLVEIIKAISRNSRVIVMDEPTSALTAVEAQYLFGQVRRLRDEGIAIVFISHKMEEVFEICDTVTVLRDGECIGELPVREVDEDRLIRMMVGREVRDMYPALAPPGDGVVLEVDGLGREGVFRGVDFQLRRGEILGLAGMMGAGRSEILRSIFGLDPKTSGALRLEGEPLAVRSPTDAIRAGIAMVSEDRAVHGFVGQRSISDNIALPNGDRYAPRLVLRRAALARDVAQISGALRIKAPGPGTLVSNLSGGNQQKVVLAKWLVRDLKVLLLDEPTRGIDVGAKQEIYRLVRDLAAQGMAIVLVSSEMPSVIAMSHRVLVVAEGRVAGELAGDEATQDAIMKMIVEGGKKHD